MSRLQKLKNKSQFKYVAAILFLGVLFSYVLIVFQPQVKRNVVEIKLPQVEVVLAKKQFKYLSVLSQGEVQALNKIDLSSEINGKIIFVSDDFKNGSFLKSSEVLIKIDDRNYKLSVVRAKAQVAAAEQQLNRVEAESNQAKKDLQQISPKVYKNASPYALRLPQLKEAQAKLKAAKADLSLAQLQLSKTIISLKFDARIKKKFIDEGQYVNAGFKLAEIYQYKTMLVNLPISLKQLRLLNLTISKKSINRDIYADLSADIANKELHWKAKVKQLNSQVDGRTQLIDLLTEVDQSGEVENNNLLLPGVFVKAKITSDIQQEVYMFPRSALHYNNELWLLTADNQLKKIRVNIIYKDNEYIYVDKGVNEGQKIIVSAIDSAIAGMQLSSVQKEAR